MPWQYWRMEELLATYMLQNIAGSLAARLRPPAATAGWRPQETVRDQQKGQDQFSSYFIHAWYTNTNLFYTCNTRTRAELQYGKPARAARGGGGV